MEIVRKLLSADEISPPDIRYDADCDCFQTTFDGTTWVDNPAADPRSAPQYQAPAPTGGDPRCDGAARMTALLKDSNDTAIHAVNVVQAYSALFAVIAIIFTLGVGLLVSLLIALADLIFSVGTTVVDDAFTSDAYDQIKCITYCHLNAGGQFDDVDAWNAYQDEIGATFGLSVVTTVLARMFKSFGFVTMNNAASLRIETGDCSACECGWCWAWDFAVDDGGFLYYDEDGCGGGTWTSGVGWIPTTPCDFYFRTTNYLDFTMPAGTVITQIQANAAPGWPEDPRNKQIRLTASDYASAVGFYTNGTILTEEITQSVTYDTAGHCRLFFGFDATVSGEEWLTRIILRGTGEVPAFPSGELC